MTDLELKVGKTYKLSDWFADYEFLGFVDFEVPSLISKFGERGALIEIGENKYVVAPDERGRFLVLARYNPKSGKKADVFLGN